MNDKQAHAKLKEINRQRNEIGVGGYRNHRREKNERHEKFNDTMGQMTKEQDLSKLKESKSRDVESCGEKKNG